MAEYIREDDVRAAVATLDPVLSTQFRRGFFGKKELERLERILGRSIESADLLELLVRTEGAQLLAARPERIGRGTSSVREKLLEALEEGKLRELFFHLRHRDPPVQVGRIVRDLVSFKWHRGSPAALRMTRAFGLPEAFAGVKEQGRDKLLEIHPHVQVPPLKAFQRGILARMDASLQPGTRMMVSSFTGTGKTRIGIQFSISKLVESEEPPLVLWVAQKRELLDQASDAMEELWPWQAADLGEALTIYRYMEGEDFETIDLNQRPGFVVATSGQLIARLKSGDPFLLEVLRRTQLLVVDEAHFALATGHLEIIKSYVDARGSEHARVLGLTATPGRSNLIDPSESRQLAIVFGKRLVVPTLGGEPLSLRWFQEQGILAEISHRALPAPSQIAQTLGKRGIPTEGADGQKDYTQEFLEVVGEDSTRNRAILNEIDKLHRANRLMLVFCCNIAQAEFLFQALVLQGVPAGVVHFNIDPRDRRGTITRFRRGEIRVLLNVEVLTTGFDAPKVDTIVMCRPTLSRILYEQMVGRGLRGPAMGGTAHCEIVDFTDNFDMFQEPQAYEAFWSDWDPSGPTFRQGELDTWELFRAEPEEE